MRQLLKRVNDIGFERTRRALAGLGLCLFFLLYLLIGLQVEELRAALLAISLCYGVAFFGVVSEWFWGRWFASGLAWSGVMIWIASSVMIGWSPQLAIFGGMHLLVLVMLMGKKMADRYDLQEGWRQRYGMDEFGVARLRKTVTRAAASLPSVILWALGPKDPNQGMVLAGAGVLAAVLAVAGVRGVVRMRSWGLLSMAGSAALLFALNGVTAGASVTWLASGAPWSLGITAALPATILLTALLPFALPAARFLTARR